MHDVHRVSRLRIAQVKQIGLHIGRADLIDRVSRAARGVGREVGGVDVGGESVFQRERVGGRVGNNEVAPVQLGHATDAVDVDLLPVTETMGRRSHDARVGLRHSGNRLGRTRQNLQAVAVHPHRLLPKLQHVGVRGFELERDQPGLHSAVLHLAQEFSARPALHTAMRHDHHVGEIRQTLPVFLKSDLPLKAGRDFTGCEGAKGWCSSRHQNLDSMKSLASSF